LRPVTVGQGDGLRQGLLHLVGGDRAVFLHAVEHVTQTLAGPLRMPIGTEISRSLGHCRQQRAFGQGNRLGGFAEIASRRHLNSPGPASQIDRIQIEFEDLRLAEHALKAGRDDDLADLSIVADIIAHQQVLGDLLGDRRSTLWPPGLRQIADERPDHAALVDPLVLEKPLVLGGHEGLFDMIGNIVE
jgi:hypothetical protein